jgi:hypothetical protein
MFVASDQHVREIDSGDSGVVSFKHVGVYFLVGPFVVDDPFFVFRRDPPLGGLSFRKFSPDRRSSLGEVVQNFESLLLFEKLLTEEVDEFVNQPSVDQAVEKNVSNGEDRSLVAHLFLGVELELGAHRGFFKYKIF